MANEIVNFPNSFVRFCEAESETCNDYSGIVFPILETADVRFALRINATTTAYLDTLNFYLLPAGFSAGDVFLAADIKGFWALNYGLISGTDYAVWTYDPLCDTGGITPTPIIYPSAEGDCQQIVLAVTSTKTIVCVASPTFQRIERSVCYTNVIRYKCADNSFGFLYEEIDAVANTPFYNKIRLRITVQSPVPVTEKTGFRKSDGSYVTLAATKQKEWSVDVDYLDDYYHQCLDAAIDHDTLQVFELDTAVLCDYDEFGFFHPEGDAYDIDWQEKPGQHLGIAKAAFKLKTNPYYSQTSNC